MSDMIVSPLNWYWSWWRIMARIPVPWGMRNHCDLKLRATMTRDDELVVD